jgi:hypothetical protein
MTLAVAAAAATSAVLFVVGARPVAPGQVLLAPGVVFEPGCGASATSDAQSLVAVLPERLSHERERLSRHVAGLDRRRTPARQVRCGENTRGRPPLTRRRARVGSRRPGRAERHAMKISLDDSRLDLWPQQVLRIDDAVALTLVCERGALWLTQDGDPRDVFLDRGDSFTLDRPGVALATALGPSSVRFNGLRNSRIGIAVGN